MDVGFLAPMQPRLEQFRQDEGLEHGAAGGVRAKLVRRSNAQQMAEQPGVEEVQLRRLDEPLAEVAVMRAEPHDEKAGLQARQPAARGRMRDAGVARQVAEIEQLTAAARAQAHEEPEGIEVADVDELAQVAFDVGPLVVAQPAPGVEPLVVNPGVKAAKQRRHQVRPGRRRPAGQSSPQTGDVEGREGCQLREREGQQVQDDAAARQRLADGPRQQEVLRAAENEPPRFVVPIDQGLHVGEQVGGPLSFVEDDAAAVLVEEAPRVFESERADVGVLQRDVVVARKRGSGERRLARLPRSGQGDDRRLTRRRAEGRTQMPGDHAPCRLNIISSYYTTFTAASRGRSACFTNPP